MSRSKKFTNKPLKPDAVFNNAIIHKLVNCIMKDGKKSLAYSIVIKVFHKLEKECDENPVNIFLTCLNKVRPEIGLRKKKVASSTYHIPVSISDIRSQNAGIRWIIQAARARKDYTFIDRFYKEIIDIYKFNKGESLKLKEKIYKMAEHNRAFSHYL